MNAPEAGVIKEFLANEEDTVTVGQDLVRIELGGAPSGDKPAATEAKQTPKEETSKEPAPETQAEQKKEPETKPQETKPAAPPAPAKEQPAAPKQPSKPEKAAAEGPATLGSREERRVGHQSGCSDSCGTIRADRL